MIANAAGGYMRQLHAQGEVRNDAARESGAAHFFGDQQEFELLAGTAIPRILDGKASGDSVRAWVLGCGTGEAAYSVAMLLCEARARRGTALDVQIFATETDSRALAAARGARYPETIEHAISPDRLAKWFVKEGHTYCISKELRETCIFSLHDLLRDVPFSRIDLISCRRMLSSLDAELQDSVVPLFHFSLRPGGYMLAGDGVNMAHHAELFAPANGDSGVFRRLENPRRRLPAFPVTRKRERAAYATIAATARPGQENSIAVRAERLAERYAPAYVVVDDSCEILQLSDNIETLAGLLTGEPGSNLLSRVHPDLRPGLQAALQRAAAERQKVKIEDIGICESDGWRWLDIIVEPLPGDASDGLHMMVVIRNAISHRHADEDHESAGIRLRDEYVRRIEAELRSTKTQLRSTVEELSVANKSLQLSTEEYESTNDEMRSQNEELETSREELQSISKELETVNGELAHRIGELARANADLKNLLDSTQIATVFLDSQLRIKRFTPATTNVFRLVGSDLGRPITEIASDLAYDTLQDDVREVLRTLGTIERELQDPKTGSRYLLRVLPYRKVDDFVVGAVLTFLDVTVAARAEEALHRSEDRFRTMALTVPAVLFTANPDLTWDYVNPRFYELTGLSDGTGIGEGWLAAVHPDDIGEARERLANSRAFGATFEHELRVRDAAAGYRWYLARATGTRDSTGAVIKWTGSLVDIHERRMAETRQRLLFAELQHRVKNVLGVIRSIASHTIETSSSLDDFAAHFEGRLNALARTQTSLARHGNEGIDLEELISEELLSHAPADESQFRISGPSIRIGERAAEALGLAIHELATNAVKYGALANRSGSISISWTLRKARRGRRLCLEWIERTVSIIDPNPKRVGFGREFLERGLPFELDADTTLEFRPGGLRFVVDATLGDTSSNRQRAHRQ